MPRFLIPSVVPAAAFALTAALTLAPAPALSLTISELVVGDFDTTNDINLVSDDIGTLDLGLNTVSGALADNCVPFSGGGFICIDSGDHTDAFLLSVAPGQTIRAIELTTSGTAPLGYAPAFGMLERTSLTFVHTDVVTDLNATRPIINGVPIGAGDYVFGLGQGLTTEPGAMAYDWTLTFEVAPIPLPAGILLSLSAFAALAAGRSRSTSA